MGSKKKKIKLGSIGLAIVVVVLFKGGIVGRGRRGEEEELGASPKADG